MKPKPLARRVSLAILMASFLNCATAQSKDPTDKPGAVGSVTFTYLGKKVTYATVRANDSNIWLQQNLGSLRVAKDFKDEHSYGDLFQWGRWDDTHQKRDMPNTRNGMPTPNNPTGLNKTGPNPFFYQAMDYWWPNGTGKDNWTAATPAEVTEMNGCDPCKAIGAGWRLPTIKEWVEVIAKEFITDVNGSMNSNLKLPLAGFRNVNSYLIMNEGEFGSYWSSTAHVNSPGAAFPMILGPGGVETKSGAYRTSGLSLRCLKAKK